MNSKLNTLVLPGLWGLYFLILGLLALELTTPPLSDPIGPQFVPYVIALLGFILSIGCALIHPTPFLLNKSGRVLVFLGLCLGYIILLAVTNFIVATFSFIGVACRYAHISWKRAALFAACITFAIRALFYIFSLPLP